MPRGVRGSKKPSISRRSRQPAAPEPEVKDADADVSALDLIAEHLRVLTTSHFVNIVTILNTRLEEVVNLLSERNELAKKLDATTSELEVTESTIRRLEKIEKLGSRFEAFAADAENLVKHGDLEKLLKRVAALEEKKERKPREVKPEATAAPAAEPAPAKPAPKSEVVICKHIGTLEHLSRPGLARCTTCGAVVDVEVPKVASVDLSPGSTAQPTMTPPVETKPAPVPAAQAVVEAKPTPAPVSNGKAPSADDVRAVAITFASKHGKPKLSEVLKEFGASNITTVPEEQRAACMAKLQAGI